MAQRRGDDGRSTGLRRGALAALQWDDVDLQSGRLTVRNREEHNHLTKSGDERSIPIAPDARAVLERLRREHPAIEPTGPVLHSAQGLPLSRYPDRITKRFKHYARMADLPEYISFHSLRDTCATWLASNGTPSVTIKEIMGHSELSVTNRYHAQHA